jgi:hypothetical protein
MRAQGASVPMAVSVPIATGEETLQPPAKRHCELGFPGNTKRHALIVHLLGQQHDIGPRSVWTVPSNASGSCRRHLARLVGDPRHQTRGQGGDKRLSKRKNVALKLGGGGKCTRLLRAAASRAAASPRKIIAQALPGSQEAEISLCGGWLFSGYR